VGKYTRNFIKYFLNLGLYTLLTCCILICLVCMVVYCLVYLVVVVFGLLLLCCCTMGVFLLSHVYYARIVVYVRIAVVLQMQDCWLEVSIRKVLRPATSTQVFLGFPMSISEC
jgi:predicted membrane metal-binding protein